MARKIQGSLLIGVAVTTILSYATGLSTMPENFTVLAVPDFSKAAFLQLDIPSALHMAYHDYLLLHLRRIVRLHGYLDWYCYRGENCRS